MTASHPEGDAPASAPRSDASTVRASAGIDVALYFTPRPDDRERPAPTPAGRGTYRERLRRGYGGRRWSK